MLKLLGRASLSGIFIIAGAEAFKAPGPRTQKVGSADVGGRHPKTETIAGPSRSSKHWSISTSCCSTCEGEAIESRTPPTHHTPLFHSTTATMSVPSLAPFIQKRPWLLNWMRPLARWYFDNAGYRKLGLKYGH